LSFRAASYTACISFSLAEFAMVAEQMACRIDIGNPCGREDWWRDTKIQVTRLRRRTDDPESREYLNAADEPIAQKHHGARVSTRCLGDTRTESTQAPWWWRGRAVR